MLRLILGALAGLCWSAVIAVFLVLQPTPGWDISMRLVLCGLVAVAAVLTFAPLQRALQLPGLTWQGMLGSLILVYTLAFVAPPTETIMAFPDMPVYALFCTGILLSVSAIAQPLVYGLSSMIFRQRAWRLDTRRIRRQAFEVGVSMSLLGVLAGLRVLSWISAILAVMIVVTLELLFLSRVEPEGESAS